MKLNVEQRRIIELEPQGHSLVKGVAGSGKTTVAIHRMAFLQEHYCPEDDDNILLVTYNKTLLKFIEYQFNELEKERDEQIRELFEDTNDIHIKTIDGLMYYFFTLYQKRHNLKLNIVYSGKKRNTIQRSIMKLISQYKDIPILTSKNYAFLLDEIDWINACDISDLDTYQKIDRTGRASGGQGPQKLSKDSRTREAIFALKEHYEDALLKDNLVDFKMMNVLALAEAKQMKHKQYTHILIDESQDLSKVQLDFLKALHADKTYASIMFVADNTQSIYSQSWLGKGRPYTTIGYDMSGKSRILSKNYRTTTEISKAAYALIEHDEDIKNNLDFVKPSLIDRSGHPPIYRAFLDTKQQAKYIVNEIERLKNDYDYKDICIIAKEKQLLKSTEETLNLADIPVKNLSSKEIDFNSEAVKLTTMHSIKGLEFKVVFLINLDEGIIPNTTFQIEDEGPNLSEERKLLYVGMTRANDLLYMTSSNYEKPSKFIKELSIPSLRTVKDSRFRPFKQIPIEHYQLINQNGSDSFKGKFSEQSKEEAVRQWLIKELNEAFNYPLELLELEYKVQQFSKTGYVDVAVMIEHQGQIQPYLFAEIKAPGEDLNETAIGQLESYLKTNPNVKYGLVTNGLEVKVFDAQMNQISDVPPCQQKFLPTTKQKMQYRDLIHGTDYEYAQDKQDPELIEITSLRDQLLITESPDVSVPIVGDVAAGIPITAIENYEESILIPESWTIDKQHTFALRVTGDSMINAGIGIGDLVIVNKQVTVDNMDICVALIEDEATVKRYMPMGGVIILSSDNPSYEPIQMNPEDVTINGKVIGVMKQV